VKERKRDREKKQRIDGGLEEERKPGASTLPESKNPDFKKNEWIHGCAVDQYTGDGQQLILMRTMEAKLPIKTHLLPFGKHVLLYLNRGLAVGQVHLSGKK